MTSFPFGRVQRGGSAACAVVVAGAPGKRPGRGGQTKGLRSPRRPRRNSRGGRAGSPLVRRAVAILACLLAILALSVAARGTAFAAEPILPDPEAGASLTVHKLELPDGVSSERRADGTDAAVSSVPSSAKPLAGVMFRLDRLFSRSEVDALVSQGAAHAGDFVSFEGKGADDGSYLVRPGQEPLLAETGEDGAALFDLTGAQGTYLVSELPDPRVERPCDPFVVNVPMEDPADARTWLYDVHVYPKNYMIDVDKVILKDGAGIMHDSVGQGQPVTFRVSCDVPSDAARLSSFTMTDELDYRLTLHGDPADVLSVSVGGTGLACDEDYTCEVARSEDADGHGRQTLFVDFTPGLAKLQQAFDASTGPGTCKVQIDFTCRLNAQTTSGVLDNQAVFDIVNQMGTERSHKTPVPDVGFAEIRLTKLDARDKATPLAGARFRIAATMEDARQGRWIPRLADDGEDMGVWEVETDTQGEASFPGLGYDLELGTNYFLVESAAPAGYSRITEPVRVHVGPGGGGRVEATTDEKDDGRSRGQDEGAQGEERAQGRDAAQTMGQSSSMNDVHVTVLNAPAPELPFTGGTGSTWPMAAGAAGIAAAAALIAFVAIRSRGHGGD